MYIFISLYHNIKIKDVTMGQVNVSSWTSFLSLTVKPKHILHENGVTYLTQVLPTTYA